MSILLGYVIPMFPYIVEFSLLKLSILKEWR